MKKIILILIVLGFLFGKQVYSQTQEPPPCVCCPVISFTVPGGAVEYEWRRPDNCPTSPVDNSMCQNKPKSDDCEITENPPSQPSQPSQPPKLPVPEEKIKPGEVRVKWEPKLISVCPPGILGKGPCQYPSLIDLFQRINELLLKISPPLLVLLIILGGLMYLLTPFNVQEYIKKGHSYIIYAIFGYILLLLVTLIFTIISAFLGGPSP